VGSTVGVFLLVAIIVVVLVVIVRRNRIPKRDEEDIAMRKSYASKHTSRFFQDLKFDPIWEIDYNEIHFGYIFFEFEFSKNKSEKK
jgi:uncharacterized membrane protein